VQNSLQDTHIAFPFLQTLWNNSWNVGIGLLMTHLNALICDVLYIEIIKIECGCCSQAKVWLELSALVYLQVLQVFQFREEKS